MKKLIFAVILCFIGCNDKIIDTPILNENYLEIYPSKIGYWWEYNVTEYDTLRNEKKNKDTIFVINNMVQNGINYFSLNKFPNRNLPILFSNMNNGVHTIWEDGWDYIYFIKYTGPGDLCYWIANYWNVDIIDSNLVLNTSIGKCKVLIYNISLSIKPPIYQDHYYYFAPGIGLVKYEKYNVNYKNEMTLMKKWEINNAYYK